MHVPDQEHKNCTDIVRYDISENELTINTQYIYFHAIYRVGKPRSPEDTHQHARPIIASFLCREDRDTVLKAKGRLKHSTNYPNAYITKDYAKVIQVERKVPVKAMFVALKKGMNAKVLDRNLVINDNVYHVGNISDEFKPTAKFTRPPRRKFLYPGQYNSIFFSCLFITTIATFKGLVFCVCFACKKPAHNVFFPFCI